MRLSEIADILAPHECTTAEALLGVLRGPGLLGLLAGQPGRGRTSPTNYSADEACRVRLLLAARDCGLTGQDLARFNVALNQPPAVGIAHPPSALSDGVVVYPSALCSIIRGTRARFGETWIASLRITRANDGSRHVSPSIFWRDADAESEVAWALDMLDGVTHVGTLILPASDLIRPLLDEPEG